MPARDLRAPLALPASLADPHRLPARNRGRNEPALRDRAQGALFKIGIGENALGVQRSRQRQQNDHTKPHAIALLQALSVAPDSPAGARACKRRTCAAQRGVFEPASKWVIISR
jgi:hypothetical protein